MTNRHTLQCTCFKIEQQSIMTFFVCLKTHTQAERKIMEGKREALMKEASESSTGSTLQDKLAELDSIKPRPYGTFPAVRFNYFCLAITFCMTMTLA